MSTNETRAAIHPLEAVHRMHFKDHYYPPLKVMTMQRTDLKNEKAVKSNMNRLIRQGAYASIILTLCIAGCIFIGTYAAYMKRVTIKDAACFAAFLGISYLCRIDSIKQKKVCLDFWASQIGEDELMKKTNTGRIYITILFLIFLGIAGAAFYDMKF